MRSAPSRLATTIIVDLLVVASAERYDPGDGSWTATATMVSPHYDHATTLPADGTVLVAGGSLGLVASAEIYDPDSGS